MPKSNSISLTKDWQVFEVETGLRVRNSKGIQHLERVLEVFQTLFTTKESTMPLNVDVKAILDAVYNQTG